MGIEDREYCVILFRAEMLLEGKLGELGCGFMQREDLAFRPIQNFVLALIHHKINGGTLPKKLGVIDNRAYRNAGRNKNGPCCYQGAIVCEEAN